MMITVEKKNVKHNRVRTVLKYVALWILAVPLFVLIEAIQKGTIVNLFPRKHAEGRPGQLLESIISNVTEAMKQNGLHLPPYIVGGKIVKEWAMLRPPNNIDAGYLKTAKTYARYLEDAGILYVGKETSWIDGVPTYKVRIYRADQVPLAAQLQLINDLVRLHNAEGRSFNLILRITKESRGKFTQPDAIIELRAPLKTLILRGRKNAIIIKEWYWMMWHVSC